MIMEMRNVPAAGGAGSSPHGENPELGEFLRSRRAGVTPAEAGIPAEAGARRVTGLRREELARLAGISVDYYVRLERGRTLNASDAVLDALARALRLNPTEREHLYALARPVRARRRAYPAQTVRPGLRRVLDTLHEVPAMIFGRRLDILAVNPLAKALYRDFDALPRRERNMARFVFLDQAARDLYVNWEDSARGITAALQLYAGRHPGDPRLAELVGDLSVRDPDFRRWWAGHDVNRYASGVKHFRHPLVGDLTLDYESLATADDPDQTLGIYTAEPGSPSANALLLLASWTATPLPEPQPAAHADRRPPG